MRQYRFTACSLLIGVLCLAGCERLIAPVEAAYGQVGKRRLLLDVYQPVGADTGLRPAVMMVHGGGWSAGDKREDDELAQLLVLRGYVVFAVNYRLVTPTGDFWPAQLDDTQRAVRWIRAHAAAYRVDPQRLAALGGSAGGHLVACLGTMPTRDDSDPALRGISSRPTCVVMLAGPTDLSDDFAPKVAEGAWTNAVMRALLGHPADYANAARSASPLFAVDAASAPTLIAHGRRDPIVPQDQAERFAAALAKAGVEVELYLFNGGHGFDDLTTAAAFYGRTATFLDRHLRQ